MNQIWLFFVISSQSWKFGAFYIQIDWGVAVICHPSSPGNPRPGKFFFGSAYSEEVQHPNYVKLCGMRAFPQCDGRQPIRPGMRLPYEWRALLTSQPRGFLHGPSEQQSEGSISLQNQTYLHFLGPPVTSCHGNRRHIDYHEVTQPPSAPVKRDLVF